MAEFSKLNGYDVKDKKAIRYYDNVAAMKADESIKEGQCVATLGYYSPNDGGGATYIITDTSSILEYQEELDNTLYATLIVENNIINVKQFGAYGDGTHDDTLIIQNIFDLYNNIIIPEGVYMINSNGIKIKSNSKLLLLNATLKMLTNSLDSYQIIDLDNVSNVTIEGGILLGDKDTHSGSSSGQSGHCIKISNGCANITLKNIKLTKGWGDGLYVNQSNNVLADNLIIDANRRNGVSVVSTDELKIINCVICNTSGTDPQCGIDIEPNSGDVITNVSIINCKIYGNTENGIQTANRYPDDYPNAISNIIITDNFISGNKIGIRPSYANELTISNNVLTNNSVGAINPYYVNNALINNNLLNSNGYNINLYDSNYNEISNNICEYATSTSAHSVNFQGSEYNVFTNNIVRNNKLNGVNLTSISSSNISQYNLIANNKIYDNSTNASGASSNLALSNYCSYNIIKDNDFIGSNTNCKYNIYVGSNNSGTTNVFIGNIMKTQTDGAMYLKNNNSLDNIIDGALDGGTLRV